LGNINISLVIGLCLASFSQQSAASDAALFEVCKLVDISDHQSQSRGAQEAGRSYLLGNIEVSYLTMMCQGSLRRRSMQALFVTQ
jgi:hypothetical protein